MTRVGVTGCRATWALADAERARWDTAEGEALYDTLAERLRLAIASLPGDTVVVHGASPTRACMDWIAHWAAVSRGLRVELHPPRLADFGGSYRAALLGRNEFVTTCTRVLAAPAPWSRGTLHAMGLAAQAGVEIVRLDRGALLNR